MSKVLGALIAKATCHCTHPGVALAVVACLSGCAGIQPQDGTQTVTRRYAGWLEVTERHSPQGSQVERVRGLGVRLGNGVLIGGFDDRRLHLPSDCRLVVILKNEEQVQQWVRLMAELHPQLERTSCVRPLDL
jgi:hypothetical protein